MPQTKSTLRLAFPGITDKQYKQFHEQLLRAEKLRAKGKKVPASPLA